MTPVRTRVQTSRSEIQVNPWRMKKLIVPDCDTFQACEILTLIIITQPICNTTISDNKEEHGNFIKYPIGNIDVGKRSIISMHISIIIV